MFSFPPRIAVAHAGSVAAFPYVAEKLGSNLNHDEFL